MGKKNTEEENWVVFQHRFSNGRIMNEEWRTNRKGAVEERSEISWPRQVLHGLPEEAMISRAQRLAKDRRRSP